MKKLMILVLLGLAANLLAQAPITADEVKKFALIMDDLEALDEEGYFDDAFDDEDNPSFSGAAMTSAILLYGFESTVTNRGLTVERFGEVAEKIYTAILRYALQQTSAAQIELRAQYQAMVDQGFMTQEDVDTILGAYDQITEGMASLSDAEYDAVISNWDLLEETLELED